MKTSLQKPIDGMKRNENTESGEPNTKSKRRAYPNSGIGECLLVLQLLSQGFIIKL